MLTLLTRLAERIYLFHHIDGPWRTSVGIRTGGVQRTFAIVKPDVASDAIQKDGTVQKGDRALSAVLHRLAREGFKARTHTCASFR